MAIPDHAGLINDEGLRNARGTPGGGDPSPLVCPNGNIRIAPFGEPFCSIGWLVLIVDPIYRSDTGFGDAHQEWVLGSARKAPGRKYVHQDKSEEHTSELQSLMRISYAVSCLKKN